MNSLKNAWYVAALADDVALTPIKQVIAGNPVVLYRADSGKAIALDDRCPHRFAPLHMGRVQGDSIECPYHGLQFNGQGVCSLNPHGDGRIPAAAKVRSYPLVEKDGLLWIWLGEPALADEAGVIDLAQFFDTEKHTLVAGYFKLNAHFEVVLDNLMDLSHAPFLHRATLANREDVDKLRFEMQVDGDVVVANYSFNGVRPSPQFQPFWASSSSLADGRANMRWTPPSSLQLDVGYTECGGLVDEGVYLHMAHLLTPASESETHYFWVAARNFCIGDEKVSQIMREQIQRAFQTEDEPMIEAVAGYMDSVDLLALKPVLLPGDAAAIRVRRVLQKLREQESASNKSKAA